jgi:hypothetical protein
MPLIPPIYKTHKLYDFLPEPEDGSDESQELIDFDEYDETELPLGKVLNTGLVQRPVV